MIRPGSGSGDRPHAMYEVAVVCRLSVPTMTNATQRHCDEKNRHGHTAQIQRRDRGGLLQHLGQRNRPLITHQGICSEENHQSHRTGLKRSVRTNCTALSSGP